MNSHGGDQPNPFAAIQTVRESTEEETKTKVSSYLDTYTQP